MCVRKPDEGHNQLLLWGNGIVELLLVMPIGFANLTLHSVAVYSMLKVTFGYGNKKLYRWLKCGTPQWIVDSTNRVGHKGMPTREEIVYALSADETLLLSECVTWRITQMFVHLIYYIVKRLIFFFEEIVL